MCEQIISIKIHRINSVEIIAIYIQQDTTLHSLFYLETAVLVSGGTTTQYQESKQLYAQHFDQLNYIVNTDKLKQRCF
jgi:hypothetical protein